MNAQRQSIFSDWKLLVGAVAVAVVSGVIGATAVLAVDPIGCERDSAMSAAWPQADSPDHALERVAAKAVPSVVKLVTGTGLLSATGSGIVLTADGLILTTSQLMSALGEKPAGDSPDTAVATFADGRTAPFRVVGMDPATDVAVVRAQGISGLTPIALGASAELRVGQQVVTLGSPLGLDGTVTTGVISALHRPVPTVADSADHTTVLDTIQTDAALNAGSMGGALIDSNGALIGVNALIATVGSFIFGPSGWIGLGFAIPVDQAWRIASQLIATGKASHAYLGVQLARDTGTRGAKIVETKRGSPAAAAGLKPGTVVTRMDDRIIASGDALVAAVLSKSPGNTVTMSYTDPAGAIHTARIVLASDRDWQ